MTFAQYENKVPRVVTWQ